MAERDIILQAEHIFRTFSIKSGKSSVFKQFVMFL